MLGIRSGASLSPAVRAALSALLVCAGYYLGGLVGLALRFPPLGISSLWPPNAILLAALLLAPPRTGWLCLLATLPAHLHLVTHYQPGVPLVTMLCQYAGNAVQALLAALVVRRFIGAPPRFDTLRSMAAFILLAALAAPAVASALAASLFVLTGWSADFWFTLRARFLTNVFPTLTIAPLIVMTAAGGITAALQAPRRLHAEFGLLTVALFAVGIPVFSGESVGPGSHPALLYAPLPLLLWAAVRFGPGGLCLSLLVVALLSLSNAYVGRGPFITRSPAENVLQLQLFLLAISLPLLLLSSLMQEQQQTAAALRESSRKARHQFAQLAAIYRTAPVGLVFFDTDLRYVSINDRLAEINGLPAEAHLGRPVREVLPEFADNLEPFLRSVIETGTPIIDREGRGPAPSQPGVERDWLTSFYPVTDERGIVLGVNTVVQEITERKRAEEALRQSRHQLEWLMDSVEGIVWEGDPQTFMFTLVSRKAERLLGYPVEQWLSGPTFWLDHLHPEDRDWAFGFCKSMTEAGRQHDFEYRMIAADGRVVWLRDIVSVAVVDGRPVQAHGIMVDITEQKRAEAALRASYEQIQDLAGRLITTQEAERTRIARELHDDINQQIAALAIALGTLQRRLPAAAGDLQVELARLQQQTIALSEGIRHLSHELHPGVLQHAGLVAALRAHCREVGLQHPITVTFRAEGDIQGLPEEMALCLYRVAQEALHNVIAHAGARAARLLLARTPDGLELTVSDDGRGFDPALARRLGGLGLISIDERVRLVGGSVRIDSQPRRGTTLRVQVPLGEAAPMPAPPPAPLADEDHEPRESTARR